MGRAAADGLGSTGHQVIFLLSLHSGRPFKLDIVNFLVAMVMVMQGVSRYGFMKAE